MARDDDDAVDLIPTTRTLDLRFAKGSAVRNRLAPTSDLAGAITDGVVKNIRVRVELETPKFKIALHGKEIAKRATYLIRDDLRKKFAQGLDAQGRPLPALRDATVERRLRRMRQRNDGTRGAPGGRADRFRVRAGGNRNKAYGTVDMNTPLHESGLFTENVSVTFKGTESGDPLFLISYPSGGQGYGADSGRGARLHAVEHYGFDRLGDVPNDLDPVLDRIMMEHLSQAIGDVMGMGSSWMRISEAARAVVETGTGERMGETDEDF